jgi:hypothetical protein
MYLTNNSVRLGRDDRALPLFPLFAFFPDTSKAKGWSDFSKNL